MAVANTSPIFSLTGLIQKSSITNAITALATSNGTAATGVSGTSGEMVVVATGDATNGSYLQRIRIRWTGSAAVTATACTIRFYISTVNSGATTSSNTYCFEEVVMSGQNAASVTVATTSVEVPLNFILPAGSYILASVGAKPAATSELCMTCYGGNY